MPSKPSDEWAPVEHPRADVRVRLTEREDGRLTVTGVHIESADRVDYADLRALRLGEIEANANATRTSTVMDSLIRAAYKASEQGRRKGIADTGTGIPRWTLDIPEQRPYDDVFYAQVAMQYQAFREAGRSPNAAIAELNDVSTAQVANWVRRARRLGFLPPPRHGAAG